MSATPSRIELLIDVFELASQRALALSTLPASELLASVLEEFKELEFLGDNPGDYQLLRAADRTPLDSATSVGHQLKPGERLVLVEQTALLPKGARQLSQRLYLREQSTGKVYNLRWQPAIIGRPDSSQEHNNWLAVDLSTHTAGPRVSRRHAQISEVNGQYFVESLSQNPTAVRSQGTIRPVEQSKQPLRNGDVIYLDRSQIALKVIIRAKDS